MMALLKLRPVIVTLAVAALLGTYWVWSLRAGALKLTEAEITAAASQSGAPGKLDLRVTLPFAPEQFHFMRLQKIGQMAGADGRSIKLRGVGSNEARALARNYWIEDITPMAAE